ncbi:hypothetical protein M1513_01395, partial [Patescibacteria group bacterium]|nr:hypothetical protein [Patescibacteria group bacterium]
MAKEYLKNNKIEYDEYNVA